MSRQAKRSKAGSGFELLCVEKRKRQTAAGERDSPRPSPEGHGQGTCDCFRQRPVQNGVKRWQEDSRRFGACLRALPEEAIGAVCQNDFFCKDSKIVVTASSGFNFYKGTSAFS